jgi:hypothetical protein
MSDLFQVTQFMADDQKALCYALTQKDETGEGYLKMDDIRSVFVDFCGASLAIESNIDSLLA